MPYQPHNGDLVKLSFLSGGVLGAQEYFGIVIEVMSAESCKVFTANGLTIDAEPRTLKPVPLTFGSASTSNFMEILAGKPVITIETSREA